MFVDKEAFIHFVGGAVGGTTGTAITCPLEVIKTRMQSSRGFRSYESPPSTSRGAGPTSRSYTSPGPSHPSTNRFSSLKIPINVQPTFGSVQVSRFLHSKTSQKTSIFRLPAVFHYARRIIKNEGFGALYKGLGPNLLGVAPSKAVYFYTYSTSKRFWNESDVVLPNSAAVHMISAGSAGFVVATVINPVWLVKTRLQLDESNCSIRQMIKRVYQREGIKGFYKGVTASYAGVSETMIQFVIYEYLRDVFTSFSTEEEGKTTLDFFGFMSAGGIAKFASCIIAYPHEVVRTRLREESNEHRGFFRTLYQLYNEGYRAMYRGLSVQLMRTVPNTAITMTTYELVVYGLHQL